MLEQLTNDSSLKFIAQIEKIFKDLPHLPKNITEILVKIAPFFAILGGILSVLSSLSMLAAGSSQNMMGAWYPMYGRQHSLYFYVTAVLSIAAGALMIMAYKHLKERKLMGWILIFWAEIISILQSVVGLILLGSGVIGAILSIAIGLYILFEMKPFYAKKIAQVEVK